MKYAGIFFLTASLLLLCSFSPARAQAPGAGDSSPSILLFVENDWFGGTDENYTSGVKLTWLSADLPENPFSRRAPRAAQTPLRANQNGPRRNLAISVGQKIFNPEENQREELIEDDRPYAGWTYVSFALHSRTERRLDILALTAGIVGPSSLGEEAQKTSHRLVGDVLPRGWDNQLDDEPGLMLTWRRHWRMSAAGRMDGWGWDAIPQAGATLGNIYTFANLGAEIRCGHNLPPDFGGSLIFPGNVSEPVAYRGRRREKTAWGVYLFGRVEGRAVARNIFLDGNTFEESHSVDKKHFVAGLGAGIAFIYKQAKLTYTHVYRTREFEEQDNGQTFGSVNLVFSF